MHIEYIPASVPRIKNTHEEGYEHIKSKLEGSQQGECGNEEAKTEEENRPNNKTGAECEPTETK